MTVTKELSAIASTKHDTSPRIVRISHIHVSPHSSIMLKKFSGGLGVSGTVAKMLKTAGAADLTDHTLPTSSQATNILDLLQKLVLFA